MGDDSTRITDELVKFIDERTLNPKIRSRIVWDMLKDKEMHSWTVVCFCVEYLKRVAVDLEYIKGPISELSQLIYHQHYLYPENIGIVLNSDIVALTKKKNELQSEQTVSDTSSESIGSNTSIKSEVHNN